MRLLLCAACWVGLFLQPAASDVVSAGGARHADEVRRNSADAWRSDRVEDEDEAAETSLEESSESVVAPADSQEEGFLYARLWTAPSLSSIPKYYQALRERLPEASALSTSASEMLAASQASISSAFSKSREQLSALSQYFPEGAGTAALAAAPAILNHANSTLLASVTAKPAVVASAILPAVGNILKVLSSARLVDELRQLLATEETARNWNVCLEMLQSTGKLNISHPSVKDIFQKIVVALVVVGASFAAAFDSNELLESVVQMGVVPFISHFLRTLAQASKSDPIARDGRAPQNIMQPVRPEEANHVGASAEGHVVSQAIDDIKRLSSEQLSAIETKYGDFLSRFGVRHGQMRTWLKLLTGDSPSNDEPDAYAPVYALPQRNTRPSHEQRVEEESNDALQ
ncbi:conserved hypothetical protein [Neospora caninum Liverpool]|nr:conserved hypothetical protein [Neospora caninum Liverpool]CBZ52553.1 conserved hypothetical protein [Neospora caninum Liverpool]|eukprot:XP_003882585.1 conserved hypothetical protein [Neospora caninum Liverpool]